MRILKALSAIVLLGLAACTTSGPRIPEDQAVQFYQPGPPFPYNSFICP